MISVPPHFRMRVVRLAAVVFVGTLPVLAGEKANITTPSRSTNAPASLAPVKPSGTFQPFDKGSSIGGVVDDSAAPPAVPLTPPDARTQKDLLERLDRKKNWLLDDRPSGDRSLETPMLPETVGQADYGTNPRRPQTALERRLKNGSRTSATEAAGRSALDQSNESGDFDTSPAPRGLRDDFSPAPVRATSLPALPWDPPLRDDSFKTSKGFAAELAPAEDLRSALSSSLGRNTGFDPLTIQRMERFQQNFADGDGTRRNPMSETVLNNSRSRELRADVVDTLLTPPTETKLAPAGGLTPTDAGAPVPLARPSVLESSAAGFVANPYAAPPTAPVPYSAPAAAFLKAPAVEPPRFRP